MSERIAAVAAVREPRDWKALIEGMTDVQRLVHLGFRWDPLDEQVWRNDLLRDNRQTYEETLREEVRTLGCGDPGHVQIGAGPELKGIAKHADRYGKGIVNTYNYDLARAIMQIGAETPTANRHVYAYRLQQWGQMREQRKTVEIGETESSWAVNQAKADFHRLNNLSEAMTGAEVRPFNTQCPVCAEYVAGNPYDSVSDAYNKVSLPAHPRCPHHIEAIMSRKLTPDECQELWLG
ncbi:MAG: hypothetical protein ABIL09_07040 [Gemmatimonadota bacterium]